MKWYHHFLLLFVFFHSVSFKQISSKKENPHFTIDFYQNGKKIEIIDNVITIEKKEFDIQFELNQPMGILVSTSYDDSIFELAKRNLNIDQIPIFESTGMAEGELNPDKEVLLSKESPSYWYYDNDKENRFNKIIKKDGKIIVTRTIKNINEIENEINRKIEEVEKPIYMVFVTYKYNKDFTNKIEFQRYFVKINFK